MWIVLLLKLWHRLVPRFHNLPPYKFPHMPSGSRVQFVVSGPFLFLLLLSAGLMTGGFWLYTHPPPPVVVKGPPFYVNRVATALRPCSQCINTDGSLKEKQKWKLGRTVSIPDGQHCWFASTSDSAEPFTIDRVPMLAVHPAINKDAPLGRI